MKTVCHFVSPAVRHWRESHTSASWQWRFLLHNRIVDDRNALVHGIDISSRNVAVIFFEDIVYKIYTYISIALCGQNVIRDGSILVCAPGELVFLTTNWPSGVVSFFEKESTATGAHHIIRSRSWLVLIISYILPLSK